MKGHDYCMGSKWLGVHLLFLTYSLLMIVSFFFKANLHEARIRKSLLAVYGAAFGQHVNYNKSAISFSANMDEAAKG